MDSRIFDEYPRPEGVHHAHWCNVYYGGDYDPEDMPFMTGENPGMTIREWEEQHDKSNKRG